ncbi:aspartic peptidase domain-containing protein [Coprinopsis sp. MPI-PUGE-AT-0042]|nr:aspartic peptidase domain-containing protein [Coprinopsis sp. MPI-PUGE-AT-0042]
MRSSQSWGSKASKVLAVLLCVGTALASGQAASSTGEGSSNGHGFELPITVRKVPRSLAKRGDVSGDVGLGNNADLLYSVPVKVGDIVAPFHLDTGSSDLWMASDLCQTNQCSGARGLIRYPSSSARRTNTPVQMFYGDSTTGTFAVGEVAKDTATVAGIAMSDQPFGLINDTTNAVVAFGTSGIFGLGFPWGSKVQQEVTLQKTGSLFPTDDEIRYTYTDGPLLTRITMTNQLELPMFAVTLQRSTIDIEGQGLLTVGRLPDGVEESELTWVPVRLYNASEGGLRPPNFAPAEVYPFRWEIDLDAVHLNGQRLAASTIPARNGMDSGRMSALLDTGNSILRGPQDVVNTILTTASPTFNPDDAGSLPTFPCTTPQTLSFEIGGKMFPIDPRDFIGQIAPGNAQDCAADNLVSTDAPSVGALFRWSLGTPFFRSNLVAFHYGNLTHPSVDPPRIGIRSNVPANARELLRIAVNDARNNGGNFEQTLEIAPTGEAATAAATTVSSLASIPIQTEARSASVTRTLSLSGTTFARTQPTGSTAGAADSPGSATRNARSYLASVVVVLSVLSYIY